MLKQDILDMYQEIVAAKGDFGDGIEHGDYDPYDVIADPKLTAFERTGVSVALLTCLMNAIDNGTYDEAVIDQGPRIRKVLSQGHLDHQPLVRSAAEAFLKSEPLFISALKKVFEQVVNSQE